MKYVIYLAFLISTSAYSQSQNVPNFSKQIDTMLDSMLIFFRGGNPEQAFVTLNSAIQLDSTNLELYELKLSWEHSLERYGQALKTSLHMLGIKSNNPRLQFLTAIYYERAGDSINAKTYYTKSIELYNKLLDTASAEQKECFSNPRFFLAIATVLSGNEQLGNRLLSEMFRECGGKGYGDYEKYLNKSRSELLGIWFSEK